MDLLFKWLFLIVGAMSALIYSFAQHSGISQSICDIIPEYCEWGTAGKYILEGIGFFPLATFNSYWGMGGFDLVIRLIDEPLACCQSNHAFNFANFINLLSIVLLALLSGAPAVAMTESGRASKKQI